MTVIKMNPDLKTPINEYFTKAANALAKQVAIIFPNARARTSHYVSFADSGRGRGRGRSRNNYGGRGRGRGGRCCKWTNMLQTRAPSRGAWMRAFLTYIKSSCPSRMQLHVELGWYKLWVQPGEERTYICIRTVINITGCQGTCERCLGGCRFNEKWGECSLTFS